MQKTNAMRLLTSAKIPFETAEYEYDEADLSGVHAAEFLKIPLSQFFKTLVLQGARNGFFVCCVPVDREVDLKKAAAVFGDKSCDMIHVKDLLATTGYIRGGCSPIGMKKKFPTFFDDAILSLDRVYVSAGTRGCSLILEPQALITYVGGTVADIIKE